MLQKKKNSITVARKKKYFNMGDNGSQKIVMEEANLYFVTNLDDKSFCLHYFWEIVLNLGNIIPITSGFTKIKLLIILQKFNQNLISTKNGEKKGTSKWFFIYCIWELYTRIYGEII